jgi:hypothetical protein
VPDPLRDPDSEFQHCASGAWQQGADHNNSIPLEMSQSIGAGDNLFDLFPKSNLPGTSTSWVFTGKGGAVGRGGGRERLTP